MTCRSRVLESWGPTASGSAPGRGGGRGWRLGLPLLLALVAPAWAMYPPLRDVQAQSQSTIDGTTVWWRMVVSVYDPVANAQQEAVSSWQSGVSNMSTVDGVVTWSETTGGTSAAQRLCFAVYDPGKQTWEAGSGDWVSAVTPRKPASGTSSGVVAWLEHRSGTDYPWRVCCAVYDPGYVTSRSTRGAWRVQRADWVPTAALHANQDGVLAWTERSAASGGSTRLRCAVYDPVSQTWRSAATAWSTSLSFDEISVGTVTFADGVFPNNATYEIGFSHANGWALGARTVPLAAFVPSRTSGSAPLTVWLTDMSIGGTGWGWVWTLAGGGSGASADRSTRVTFSGTGSYTVTQTVSSANGTDTESAAVTTDTTAPTGTVVINGGDAYTRQATVTLGLSATDNSGTVTGMRFSTDSTDWSSWYLYGTSASWTLPAGDGDKTVYAQFRDAAGLISDTASDTIMLDDTAPTLGTVTVTPDPNQSYRATVAWSGFADPTSHIASYEVRYNGPSTSGWTAVYSGTDLSCQQTVAQSGYYLFIVRAIDYAGNSADSAPVEAYLGLRYRLDVASTPVSGANVVGAPTGTTPYSASMPAGQTVLLTAPSTLAAGDVDYAFVSWTVTPGTGEPITTALLTFILQSATTATAQYQVVQRTLSVQSQPADGVVITGTPAGTTPYQQTLADETAVSLTAPLAAGGLPFLRWEDGQGVPLGYRPQLNLNLGAHLTAVAAYGVATDYYVNDDTAEGAFAAGDNTNAGTSAHAPMRDLALLLTRYPDIGAGVTVHLGAGTFRERVELDAVRSGLTLTGAGAEQTVLDAQRDGPCLTLTEMTAGTVRGLRLVHGQGTDGGAIRCLDSTVTLRDLVVTKGYASGSGGGLWVGGTADVLLVNSVLAGNEAPSGAGVFAAGGRLQVVNVTLTGNRAGTRGGGVWIESLTEGLLANTLFWANTAPTSPDLGQATRAACEVRNAWLGDDTGQSPLFVLDGQWSGSTWTDGDYHLQPASPCVDAGATADLPAGVDTDLDGRPRVRPLGVGPVDIGAYELAWEPFSLQFRAGWNLFSTPTIPSAEQAAAMLDALVGGVAWQWNDTAYGQATSFVPGRAYWGYCQTAATVPLSGEVPAAGTVACPTAGWQLLGPQPDQSSALLPLPPTVTPAGARLSPAWTWTGTAYAQPTEAAAGSGLWLLTGAACQVDLRPAAAR